MTISEERKKRVIDLYYNQGKTTREIAKIEVPLTIFGTIDYFKTEQSLRRETLNKLETLVTIQEKNIQNT